MPVFDARFDVSSVQELERKLSRLPRPVENEVRKSNRKWAAKLRDFIRAEANAILGRGSKYGGRHDTRPGAIARSIKSRASGKSANVYGGGPGAPHFNVQEFGGGVYWVGKSGKGHYIPIGSRTNVSSNAAGNARGAQGKFFWPTTEAYAPQFGQYITEDAIRIVHETLSS